MPDTQAGTTAARYHTCEHATHGLHDILDVIDADVLVHDRFYLCMVAPHIHQSARYHGTQWAHAPCTTVHTHFRFSLRHTHDKEGVAWNQGARKTLACGYSPS